MHRTLVVRRSPVRCFSPVCCPGGPLANPASAAKSSSQVLFRCSLYRSRIALPFKRKTLATISSLVASSGARNAFVGHASARRPTARPTPCRLVASGKPPPIGPDEKSSGLARYLPAQFSRSRLMTRETPGGTRTRFSIEKFHRCCKYANKEPELR